MDDGAGNEVTQARFAVASTPIPSGPADWVVYILDEAPAVPPDPDGASLAFLPIGTGLFNSAARLADGTPVVWHDGIGFGGRSIFLLLPQSGDGLIILTNKGDGNTLFREMVCLWDYWLHGEQTRLCKSY